MGVCTAVESTFSGILLLIKIVLLGIDNVIRLFILLYNVQCCPCSALCGDSGNINFGVLLANSY